MSYTEKAHVRSRYSRNGAAAQRVCPPFASTVRQGRSTRPSSNMCCFLSLLLSKMVVP